MKKLQTITLDFARKVVEEETGVPFVLPAESAAPGDDEAVSSDPTLRLIARDDKRNPLVSALEWSDEAVARLFRVPVGFMRTRTQNRVEALATERRSARILAPTS